MPNSYANRRLVEESALEVLQTIPNNPELARKVIREVAAKVGLPCGPPKPWGRRVCVGMLVAAIGVASGVEIEQVSLGRALAASLDGFAACRALASGVVPDETQASSPQKPVNYILRPR